MINNAKRWQDRPDEVGDYLFVLMMECGCCVDCAGIGCVFSYPNEGTEVTKLTKMEKIGDKLWWSWEGQKPREDMKLEYFKFLKIELPEVAK